MYQMRCEDEKYESKCRRLSCVHPDICKHLKTDHGPLIDLMRRVRKEPGVKHVHIASGVRTDLVVDGERGGEYLEELARHHVGGQLSVAPEHVSDETLRLMKKPPHRELRSLHRGVPLRLRGGGQGAVPHPLLHQRPSGLDARTT